MVTPTVALPNLQMPVPPAHSAVLTTAPSDAAIGRLPVFTVASPVPLPEPHNQTQGGSAGRFAPARAEPASTPAPQAFSAPAGGTAPRIGPSSAFLAQLFAQTSNDTPLREGFFSQPDRLNIFEPDTIIRFSNVKYLPSNAAKPRFEGAPTQPFVELRHSGPSAAPAQAQRATEVQQQAVQREVAAPSATATAERSAGNAPVAVRAVGNQPESRQADYNATESQDVPEARAHDSSAEPLSVTQGINAYLATVTRNAANGNRPVAISPVDAIL